MVAAGLPVLAAAPAAVAAPAIAASVAATNGMSVTYQIDAKHDGNLTGAGLGAPPLTEKWSRDFGADISYPIVAGGRVFTTVSSTTGYGTELHGFDAATGQDLWAPIPLGGTYWWSALAFGGGRVFAQNYDGLLSAVDPATGQVVWSVQLPGQYAFSSPPTFRAGTVYTGGAGSAGTVYAVRASDGAVLWTQGVGNGDDSSPAVTATAVYVSYGCEQTYAFDPVTGAPLWHHDTECEGGGGRTPVVAGNALWIRDDAGMTPAALRLANGTVRSTYPDAGWVPAPAFSGKQGYFVANGVLRARDTSTLAAQWTFPGDGQLTSAPVTVDGYVYVGSATGMLWAVDPATGTAVWSADAGSPIAQPDEHNVSQPLTGFGAGGGLLVVPASHTLVAYGK